MSSYKEIKAGRRFIGRAGFEKDVLEEITGVCVENDIKLGKVSAIGALRKANIGYYHQDTREYEYMELDKHMEILSLIGNVSIKDGKPMVHAHIVVGDEKGNAFGGHLSPGTVAFACEFIIEEYTGAEMVRGFDEPTGLTLWTE